MKKVLFCTLNSKYIHSTLAPWYLCAAVENFCQSGIEADVIEGTVNEQTEKIIERIVNCNPDVIGFSAYIWNRTKSFEVISGVKKHIPSVKVVIGGPEVAYDVAKVLENPLIDYVISGEGEWPIAKLIDSIFAEKTDINDIDGVSFRDDSGKALIREPYISYEDPPFPYTEKYLSALKGRIAYLETSRGCPYNCAYCLSGRCGGVRFFDLEKTKENMLILANSGTKTIKLVDRTFNADKKRAQELFSFVVDNYAKTIPSTVCFHFEISAEILDAKTIEILHSAPAGAIQLEIGIQSYNEKTLSHINRKCDLDKLDNNIRKILEVSNIHVHVDLIAGLPYESMNDFANGFNRAYKLHADMLQLGFLKLLHGAPMREEKEKYLCEYNSTPPYEVISTPWLSCDELDVLHSSEDALDRLYNSGRFSNTLDYLFNVLKLEPFCFFKEFGAYVKAECKNDASLDKYTDALYSYLVKENDMDKVMIRDLMIIDRMQTCSTGYVPLSLRIDDKNLSLAKKALDRLDRHKSKKGIKRMVAILYSENKVAYADYNVENMTKDKYKKYVVKKMDLDLLLQK